MTTATMAAVGKYRIVRVLGHGAMGQVYLAEDPHIGRQVAVKVMLTSGQEDELRFVQEARVIGALSHPNIVVIHDFGFHEGRPYLVMEYLPGVNLQVWLRDAHPLAAHLRVMEGLAAALVHAHSRGVLHRDVKPSNLQVLPDGSCKLMDFGIARTQSLLTASAQVVGTPGYLPPEVLEDAAYSRQADVYAAGVLLYEMMAGANPFAGQTVAATLNNVLRLEVPPLRAARPDLPPALADAITACLARDPRRRPADLSHVLEVVRATSASPATIAIEVPRAGADLTQSLLDVPSTRRRKRASRVRSAAAAVLGLSFALSAWYALRPVPSTPVVSPAPRPGDVAAVLPPPSSLAAPRRTAPVPATLRPTAVPRASSAPTPAGPRPSAQARATVEPAAAEARPVASASLPTAAPSPPPRSPRASRIDHVGRGSRRARSWRSFRRRGSPPSSRAPFDVEPPSGSTSRARGYDPTCARACCARAARPPASASCARRS